MNSNMDVKQHHECVQRALALGRSNDPAALPELTGLLKMPSAEIRRLAASAIGKLAGFGADPQSAVAALAPLALRDPHPQVRQYALKALKAFGPAAQPYMNDLRDTAENPAAKDYVRTAASSAAEAIAESVRIRDGSAVHQCFRCSKTVSADEYARAQKMFQRTFCDHCFDETYIQRRNFDTRVEVSMLRPALFDRFGPGLVGGGEGAAGGYATREGFIRGGVCGHRPGGSGSGRRGWRRGCSRRRGERE
jgi:hypothetical protein